MGFYLAQPRHDPWRGTAAPRWVARRTLTRQRSSLLVAATSALCRARAIGAAKSVSLKKIDSVRFKIIFKKGLKLKKIPAGQHTWVHGKVQALAARRWVALKLNWLWCQCVIVTEACHISARKRSTVALFSGELVITYEKIQLSR